MSKVTGETELAMARRHVRECAARVTRQREIIEMLRRGGYPTDASEDLLARLEEAQVAHKSRLATL